MAVRNGALPAAVLAPIGGGYQLANPAAAAFNAMSAESRRRFGTPITVLSAYRPLAKQWYLWRLYQSGRGNLAAFPGSSNHGWGLAIDLSSPRMRQIVNAIGAHYGWAKAWSDAPSEWWHIKYRAGAYKGRAPARVLRPGSRGEAVKVVQRRLRALGFRSVAVTGYYGKATTSAVRRFQRKHHLPVDGICGPRTRAAIRRTVH